MAREAKHSQEAEGPEAQGVSGRQEVMEALSRILRGEGGAKPSEVLRAAELLGKRYNLFAEREEPREPPVIVDDLS